jgi:hypothetical protein
MANGVGNRAILPLRHMVRGVTGSSVVDSSFLIRSSLFLKWPLGNSLDEI